MSGEPPAQVRQQPAIAPAARPSFNPGVPAIICQLCQKRPASTHLTELQSPGGWVTVHACASCLASRSLDLHQSPVAAQQLLHQQLPAAEAQAGEVAPANPDDDPRCPTCGLAWSAFQTLNRYGCSSCLDAFGEPAREALADYHGHDHHVPRPAAGEASHAAQRRRWEQALAAALAAEDYREAARLRDLLRGCP
jgi:protein arginine kinase activator